MKQCALNWSTQFLSTAGKAVMIQSVLSVITSFSMTCFDLPVSLCKRIQSVLTRFWWDSKDGVRKICWVSWEKLTQPKDLERLGFRDIQAFNHALLAKIGWRLLTNPDYLLAKVLLGKYCHKTSFLKTQPTSSISHGWRGILWGRDLLLNHLGKAVGNGESTSVWTDSWIQPETKLKPIGPVFLLDRDLMVSDLLTRETREWNTDLVEKLMPELKEHVLKLRPSVLESVDHILFHCQYANEVWRYGPWNQSIDTTDATTFFEKLERSWNLTPLPPYGFTGNALPWICWALKEWEIAQPPSLKIPKSLTTGQQHNPMVLDPSEIFCNTDASWSHTSKEAGLAWIFTNGSATEIFRGSIKQSAASSPCMGEALAMREALLQAATNHYSIICIRTYSQVLAQAITSRRKTTELYGILSDIDELAFSSSSPFINCRFTYISRANNGPADGLAKACLVAQPVVNPNQNSV
ncbi:uncharacterized protein LOC125588433 [Brassica napus]|uniref:uncharacterized protein LOC125588433 n=1 Tax=Brassica napus TaxID=3708 RepID=UPI00207A46D5|nr:uncharacterized protein LOC125588433 [Brassica napus]